MKRYIVAILFLICGSVMSAEEPKKERDLKPSKLEGAEYVKLDNGYRVWTKRIGNGPIKILTLHGGPAASHEYLECMEDFFPKDKYQIIFYDQLGSYYSDQPDDTSLWTIDRFCLEVEQVRCALGLENFYLFGHSWGGMLGIEYALKFQKHLKGLVISNMTASIDSYVAYLNELRSKLPQAVQNRLKAFEEKEDFLNPEYEKIMFEEVYSHYLCSLKPWPEPLMRAFVHLNQKVYQTLQGPNEFVILGNFKDWNRWNDLRKITVPTLVIGAKNDTMNPKDIEKMATLLPQGRVKICNGTHCSLYDDQENYFQALIAFLTDIEKTKNN